MDTSPEIARWLQDQAAMRQFLGNQLRSVTGTAFQVHDATLDYFRQSPTRITAQYSLDLESTDGLRDSQIITVTHFTDGRSERQWKRFSADAPDAVEPVGKFNLPGATYSQSLQSIVQAFPFDIRLPGLRKTVAGSREIRRLISQQVNLEIVSWRADVVRYRPDMRAMACLHLGFADVGPDANQRLFVKVYREIDEGQRAFNLLEALTTSTTSGNDFRVPRPLGYDAELRTLLLAEAPGDRLLDIVRRNGDERAPDAVRRAARAVSAMHGASLPAGLLPTVAADKDAQFADVAARLERSFPALASALQSLTQHLQATFRPAPLRPTHYDLKQGHMLVDSSAVTILDFDKMAMGDPLIDVANVVATLGAEREGGARRASRRDILAELFVDEYFSRVPSEWAALFPAHLARATVLEAGTTGRGNRGRKGTSRPEERLIAALHRAEAVLAS